MLTKNRNRPKDLFFFARSPPPSFYSLSGPPLSRVGREGGRGVWRWLRERGEEGREGCAWRVVQFTGGEGA